MQDENYFDELVSEPESEPVKINDSTKLVLKAISRNPDITQTGLVKETKLTLATVKRRLVELKGKGYIERVGSDRKGYWKVLK